MKYKIIEKDIRNDQDSFNYWVKIRPLSYRVSIELIKNQILLVREYFCVGFNDGEVEDGFYFNNRVPWKTPLGVTRATFYTRNFNSDYLKQQEDKLVELFYEELINSENNYKQSLKSEIKKHKDSIKFYKECQNSEFFIKMNRRNKLNSIGGFINEDY